MSRLAKGLRAASTSSAGVGLNVENVFASNPYYPIAGPASWDVWNDIYDWQNTGMMFMGRRRDELTRTGIYDTSRGAFSEMKIEPSDTESSLAYYIYGTRANGGMTLNGSYGFLNTANDPGITWMFKKTPRFFDQFIYSGNGNPTRTINHSLDDNPGFIIIKARTTTDEYTTWNNSYPSAPGMSLVSSAGGIASDISNVTSTSFQVNASTKVNDPGVSYVCYVFADNNNSGNFGPTGDQDIIRTGSYVGADNPTFVDVGFVPQWILIKAASGNGPWYIVDMMRDFARGINTDPSQTAYIRLDASSPEVDTLVGMYPYYGSNGEKGFAFNDISGNFNSLGKTYFYMAIRRPMAIPESGSDVWVTRYKGELNSQELPAYKTDYSNPVGAPIRADLALFKDLDSTGASGDTLLIDRNRATWYLITNGSQQSIQSITTSALDFTNGFGLSPTSDNRLRAWIWEAAPKFFNLSNYTGTGSAQSIQHELDAVPEMVWVKDFVNGGKDWMVYHSAVGTDNHLKLNESDAQQPSGSNQWWNNTAPTNTTFTVGTSGNVNSGNSGSCYTAYLFATLAGVSKVGSYSGTGVAQNIDCGFSTGARFVLIKRYDAVGNWILLDSARGIGAGNDLYTLIDTNIIAEQSADLLSAHNAGFGVTTNNLVNDNGGSYIFYAIS
jgi:hypothetical protein